MNFDIVLVCLYECYGRIRCMSSLTIYYREIARFD